jgi:hypothetical protein
MSSMLAHVKERTSKEDAVAQVFSEELLPFFESASLPLYNDVAIRLGL